MKKNILYIFLLVFIGCTHQYNDGYLCRFLYFPISSNEDCFWVEVEENHKMKVTHGNLNWDFLKGVVLGKEIEPEQGIAWEKTKAVDSTIVNTEDYMQLEELATEVSKRKSVNNFLVSISNDGQGIVLFIKDKYYYVELGDYNDKSINDLYRKLKDISPIPIRSSAHP